MYCNQNVGQNYTIKTGDKYLKNVAKFKYSQTTGINFDVFLTMHHIIDLFNFFSFFFQALNFL